MNALPLSVLLVALGGILLNWCRAVHIKAYSHFLRTGQGPGDGGVVFDVIIPTMGCVIAAAGIVGLGIACVVLLACLSVTV